MGWMYEHKPADKSITSFFDEKFSFDLERQSNRLLDCAIEKADNETGGREVFAVICLLDYAPNDPDFNFGYKDVEESMGPAESECPERILELLTPTSRDYARQWRARCREHIARRKELPSLKKGHYLVLDEPLSFTDGSQRDTFYIADARRRLFEDGYTRCKLARRELERIGYRVLQHRPTC